MQRRISSVVQAAGAALLVVAMAAGAHAQKVNTASGGVAVKGYDVVAYVVAAAPAQGSAQFEHRIGGTVYRFASAANLAAFEADPGRYLPGYGGFCAYGVRMGRKLPIDPTAFEIVDGRLYLFLDRATKLTWHQDQAGNIQIADKIWPELARTE
jgi:YHS domain-containing protein